MLHCGIKPCAIPQQRVAVLPELMALAWQQAVSADLKPSRNRRPSAVWNRLSRQVKAGTDHGSVDQLTFHSAAEILGVVSVIEDEPGTAGCQRFDAGDPEGMLGAEGGDHLHRGAEVQDAAHAPRSHVAAALCGKYLRSSIVGLPAGKRERGWSLSHGKRLQADFTAMPGH
jgi:hypothetical protein